MMVTSSLFVSVKLKISSLCHWMLVVVISSLCCLEADDKLSMSPDAGSGDQLPMCIGGADDKLSMSLAAGDQLPICLGDADDNLSISLAAGGSGDRFSFLINRMPQRSIRSRQL